MNDITKKIINSTEVIEQNIPALIEAFVSFYGEESRQHIKEKFENMLIASYSTPDMLNQTIMDDKKMKCRELIDKFNNQIKNNPLYNENILNLLIEKDESFNSFSHPIFKYMEYKEKLKRTPISFIKNLYPEKLNKYRNIPLNEDKKNILELIKKLYPNKNIWNIDGAILSGSFPELDQICENYTMLLKEYNVYLESIKEYELYISSCSELKNKLIDKYERKILDSLKDLFTSEELKNINMQLDKHCPKFLIDNPKYQVMFGSCLDYGCIDSFSAEKEEILKNDNSWRAEQIKSDRIYYFNLLGINYGDDYSKYENDPIAISKMPSKVLVDRIRNTITENYEDMLREFYPLTTDYAKNRERMESFGLLDIDGLISARTYHLTPTCVSPNVRNKNGNIELSPVVYIPMPYCNLNLEMVDESIIHELNHVFELNLLEALDNKYSYTCGWEEYQVSLDENSDLKVNMQRRNQKREYELFNEIINELISQNICQNMFDSNHYVFGNSNISKVKNVSDYEPMRIFVEEFYEQYKDDIIASRRNGNKSVIIDKVGKDNFDALNSLINRFWNEYSYEKREEILNSIQSGNEIYDNKFQQMLEQKDLILSNMHEYSNQNSVSL